MIPVVNNKESNIYLRLLHKSRIYAKIWDLGIRLSYTILFSAQIQDSCRKKIPTHIQDSWRDKWI